MSRHAKRLNVNKFVPKKDFLINITSGSVYQKHFCIVLTVGFLDFQISFSGKILILNTSFGKLNCNE